MTRTEDKVRLQAVRVFTSIISDGKSLARLLPPARETLGGDDPRSLALLQELTFGASRWSLQLEHWLAQILSKPMRKRDDDVRALLMLGLYEAHYLRTPDYAVVDSYVRLVVSIRKKWARGLVNATLRNFIRNRQNIVAKDGNPAARHGLPEWFETAIRADWPPHAEQIIEAGNSRAPLSLRINLSAVSREQYLDQLRQVDVQASADPLVGSAVRLHSAAAIESLPGYHVGLFSVQDAAAQLAPGLLNLQSGMRVLDACAAPGGKTGHLLEYQSGIDVTALDTDAPRLQILEENLARLGLQAQVKCAAAEATDSWWDSKPFDRILLDAPCSAVGVLRRHPDIRLLRRGDDIQTLAARQATILAGLWRLLSVGGRLLYVTCSFFRRENEAVIADFLARNNQARERPIFDAGGGAGNAAEWGHTCLHGRQILPGQHDADGFYYAILEKV